MRRALRLLFAGLALSGATLIAGGCPGWDGTQDNFCDVDADCDQGQICVRDPIASRVPRCAIPCKHEGEPCEDENQLCFDDGSAEKPLLLCYPVEI